MRKGCKEDLTPDVFQPSFEACFVWGGGEGKVVAAYKVEPEIEQDDGSVQGRIVEFIHCRIIGIGEGITHYDLDGVKSSDIRDQVKRLLGRSLEIPGAVRTGAPLYIPKP
jgi:hypothetical protein